MGLPTKLPQFPPKVLQERLDTMVEVLGLPVDRLRALVAEKPILLTKSSAAVREAVRAAKQAGQV